MAKTKKPTTVQFINGLIKGDCISCALVMNAIQRYAEAIRDYEFTEADEEAIIAPIALKQWSSQTLEKLDEFYNEKS
jgi:hypothetical protein